MAFDTRLGLYDDPIPPEALQFINEVQNFFALSHKLTFSAAHRIAGHCKGLVKFNRVSGDSSPLKKIISLLAESSWTHEDMTWIAARSNNCWNL